MGDFRESLFWDKALEGDLPDCRLRYPSRERLTTVRGQMEMDVVFCATCGEPKGLVPVHCPHVYFLCDNCFNKMNGTPPPGTARVPDEVVDGWHTERH